MPTKELRAAAGERAEEVPMLPLPPVVDTPAVVLLGLLCGGGRPLVVDATAVREVEPAAEPLLEALLGATLRAGLPARSVGAGAQLRRACAGRPLAAFFADAPADDEQLFVCPDRDAPGFQPSPR